MSEDKDSVPKMRFLGFTDAWERRKLGDVIKMVGGATPSKANKDYWGGDIVWLSSQEIKDRYVSAGTYTITEKAVRESATKVVPAFTPLIVSRSGILARMFPIALPTVDVAINQDIKALFFDSKILDTDFFVSQLEMKENTILTSIVKTGTTVQSVNMPDFEKLIISIPCIQEQQKIGKTFKCLDKIINLHQRKLNNVKNLKAGLLQKMFPKNGEDFPEVRFPGFTDAWVQRRFVSVFDPIPNNTLSRADLNYDDGKIKSVHYGDILIKYGAVTDCGKDVIPFITGAEVSDYQSQLLQDGDVLIADAAEDETVGKATEIAGVTSIPVVSGLHTIACRPKVKMQPNYLGYYMNSPSYHQQLIPLMQGIKVLSISRTNLAQTIICYPTSAQEQSQIGKVFAYIDHLITLHQRKLAHLQQQKKSLLHQMFV